MFKNKSLSFIVLVYVLTALYSLIYLKFPIAGRSAVSFAATIIYMFIPLVVTLILQLGVYKEPVRNIGIVFKWHNWYIVAALIPLVTAGITFGISLLMPGVAYDPSMTGFLDKMAKMVPPEQMEKAMAQFEPMAKYMLLIIVVQALIAGATVNAVAAFGEEAGWRGFFLQTLKGKNFYVASIIIGLVWGFWHMPVILQGHNYPQHPVLGVFLMTVFTVLLSPLLSYVVLKTGSVIAAAILHGVLNASAGIPLMYIRGGDDLTVGITGIAGFASLLIFNILLFFYDRFIAKEKLINF